jgi:hypothetical protein
LRVEISNLSSKITKSSTGKREELLVGDGKRLRREMKKYRLGGYDVKKTFREEIQYVL